MDALVGTLGQKLSESFNDDWRDDDVVEGGDKDDHDQ